VPVNGTKREEETLSMSEDKPFPTREEILDLFRFDETHAGAQS
jgi:hypothetical protein